MFHPSRMKLAVYLHQNRIPPADFARECGVTQKAVEHWMSGNRHPRPAQMQKINELTKGSVTANDFMSAAPQTEAAE